MSRARAAALVLLLLGIAGVIGASRLTIGAPARPGPGFFPFWLALALGLVALALLLRAPRLASAPTAALAERPRTGKVVLALAGTVGYAAALDTLGFVLTTFLFLAFLLTIVEPRPWRSVFVISAVTAVSCHVVFKVWLNVQLPAGSWGF